INVRQCDEKYRNTARVVLMAYGRSPLPRGSLAFKKCVPKSRAGLSSGNSGSGKNRNGRSDLWVRRRRSAMAAIFVSYGREDTEGQAGRLFGDLTERFGKDVVFMDVAGIEPGRDFRRVIEQQVASCGVLLAVIGKSWLTGADEQGRRRLDDPIDFVRL